MMRGYCGIHASLFINLSLYFLKSLKVLIYIVDNISAGPFPDNEMKGGVQDEC